MAAAGRHEAGRQPLALTGGGSGGPVRLAVLLADPAGRNKQTFAYSKMLLAFFALPGFLAAGEGVGDRCMILTTNKLALEHPHKPETGRFPVRRVIQQSTPLALRDRVDVIDTVRDLPNPPTGSTDVLTDSEPGSINVGSPNGPNANVHYIQHTDLNSQQYKARSSDERRTNGRKAFPSLQKVICLSENTK